MIDRVVDFMSALGGQPADPRATLLADRVTKSGVAPARVADAIAIAVEARVEPAHGTRGLWIFATTGAAVIAAIVSVRALLSSFELLHPYGGDALAFLPLGAIVFAVLAWARLRRESQQQIERETFDLALAIAGAGVPAAIAFEVAAYLADLPDQAAHALTGGDLSATEPERAHLYLLREHAGARGLAEAITGGEYGWMVLPALSAGWAVISYWGLYFASIAAHATAPWYER